MKKRVISTWALLFASVSAIIGSGWLFAAYYAATSTGTSALLSWLIGGVAMVIVAFTFAELSAFVPVTGASIRVPRYTHGQLIGFIFAWIIWITYFALMAVEVQAIVQYGSFFYPGLVHSNGGLTSTGYLVATVLMLLVSTINFYSLVWLLRCNSFLTILKIIIPLAVALAIVCAFFTPGHSPMNNISFAPSGFKGILGALTTGGIIFAFNGFRQATEMAGEAKNPQRSLPIAIVGGICICLLIYLALQYSFLSAIGTNAHLKDWSALKLTGNNSPFAIVLTQAHLHYLLPVLYIGAVIGPFAAALMYCSSGARALYAMSQNGSIPHFLGKLNHKHIPIMAIGTNFALGMCLFAPFPGWASMANFLTSLMALTYIVTPVCLLTLRTHTPEQKRYFKLPFARLWVFIAFYICALLVYWTGWDVLCKLYIALAIGLAILIAYRLAYHRETLFHLDWKASLWAWVFFAGMSIISHLGSFGGNNTLSFGWDFLAIAALSLISLQIAIRCTLPAKEIHKNISQLIAEHR